MDSGFRRNEGRVFDSGGGLVSRAGAGAEGLRLEWAVAGFKVAAQATLFLRIRKWTPALPRSPKHGRARTTPRSG